MCAVIRKMISGIELYNNEVKELNFNFASQINEGRTLFKGTSSKYIWRTNT